jgi:hypothetical protein
MKFSVNDDRGFRMYFIVRTIDLALYESKAKSGARRSHP